MAGRVKKLPADNLAELVHQFGDIDLARIRANPLPGTATEADVIRIHDREDRLFELVDGVLVEKVMGQLESSLGLDLARYLGNFLEEHDLGYLTGSDGAARLMPGLVRYPDLSFFSWERLGQRERLTDPIAGLGPDVAIEVLSAGNTPGEMLRKRKEYFLSGARLVWLVDPVRRTVKTYSAADPETETLLTEDQTLTAGDVLPGFALPLAQLFKRIPRTVPTPSQRRRRRKEG